MYFRIESGQTIWPACGEDSLIADGGGGEAYFNVNGGGGGGRKKLEKKGLRLQSVALYLSDFFYSLDLTR